MTGRVRLLRSLRFRVVAAFLAALIAMVVAQGTVVWQQRRVAATIEVLTGAYLPLSKTVAQLDRDRLRIEADVQRILREERSPDSPEAPALIWLSQLQENLLRGMEEAQDASTLDLAAEDHAAIFKAISHLATIQSLFRDLQSTSEDLVEAAATGNMDRAASLAEPLERYGTGISEEIEKLSRLVDDRIVELNAAAEADRVRATTISGAVTATAAAFALVLIGAVLYALRPIGQLTAQVQRLAAGDYEAGLDVRGGDEIGVLAAEFDRMVAAIRARDRTLVERADELRRLTRYLSSVLDSLEDGLVVVEDGVVTLSNPSAQRVWHAERGGPTPDALVAVLDQPRADIEGPDRSLHEVRTSPLGSDGVVVITADVTEITADKERLARSERLALVGQMLAQITHEVRNPLNALSLNTELLGDEIAEVDPDNRTEARVLLETVSGEIDRLTAVTHHYLQLARRPRAELAPCDLAALIDDVVRLVDIELERSDVSLTVSAAALPVQLVDGNQLRQALLNVLRNAVEAGGR